MPLASPAGADAPGVSVVVSAVPVQPEKPTVAKASATQANVFASFIDRSKFLGFKQ